MLVSYEYTLILRFQNDLIEIFKISNYIKPYRFLQEYSPETK